jgi:hypothetical protein
MRNAYKILVSKPEMKRQHGRYGVNGQMKLNKVSASEPDSFFNDE